jgi:diguanylate cyclase (GGDEF)-like protein
MAEPSITSTIYGYNLTLLEDGTLLLREEHNTKELVLTPQMASAFYNFVQRSDVQEHLGGTRTKHTDPVTGFFSRRYLPDVLARQIHRAASSQRSIGIMVLDIDHFATLVDMHGHDAGDTLRRVVGAFLQINIRSEDLACWSEDEEFALVLPGASLDDARGRAEDLCAGIKHVQLQHNSQSLGTITASIGVAGFPEHGSSAEGLIEAARQAMRQAQERGGDRVMIYESSGE